MKASDIKLDWEELVDRLFHVTNAIRTYNKLEIFDGLEGKLLPEPDAIVLIDDQICPVWKVITDKTMWKGLNEHNVFVEYPTVHTLFSLHFDEEGKMSMTDNGVAGLELIPGKTLYESIQKFNNNDEDDGGKISILYIIEE